jgi:hypothetical protein
MPRRPQKATSYLPSISDFMIATIQPRHVGLWIAARSGDWSFAAYQLGNLKGAFDRLGRAYPMEHETPLQEMISSVIAQPFEDTRKAIETKDSTAFSRAYGDLTSALQLRPSGHKPWRGRHSGADRLINLRPGL